MEHHSNRWLRSGATVYQLMHHGWNKGVETFRNAFRLHISADRDSGYDGEELARRIVACVNACAGLDTKYLEEYGLPGYAQTISDLGEKVDELLLVLKEIAANDPYHQSSAGILARAAIAHVNKDNA